MRDKMRSNLGQATIFIILGIIIVALVIVFISYRTSNNISKVPASLEEPYEGFLSCIADEAWLGIRILETQGGYIDLPEFEPGSTYMPFSSQLNFLGNPLPYWYYVTGNNIQKEQVPSKSGIQRELSKFIEERINDCDLEEYVELGYNVEAGEPKVSAIIKDSQVIIELNMDLSIRKGLDMVYLVDHEVTVESMLGKLYDDARDVYDKEQEELFLEDRGLDILRLYAPVDGIEISCSPLFWDAENVFDDLEEAIEANTFSLRSSGEKDDYFVLDLGVSSDVRFMNSRNWSSTFEVVPSEGRILIANPVGNQPGLGILGFCYVPYHFVYDLKYPVLVQVQDGEEIFQFPVAVVIQGNNPREPLEGRASELASNEFCKDKNTKIEVNTYNIKKGPVSAELFYECGGAKCYIGNNEKQDIFYFPQCVNGKLVARAQGYAEGFEIFSSVYEGRVDVYLDKIYDLDVVVKLDGRVYGGDVVISFVSNDSSASVAYPEQSTISLSRGNYSVQVYIYENSSLTLPGDTIQQCVEVPRTGIPGLLGLKTKHCFDVEFDDRIFSNTLVGGGEQQHYILTSELEGKTALEISVESLPKPDSLEDIQVNYLLFGEKGVDIKFR